MTDTTTIRPISGLPARISQSLEVLWTRHSGQHPGLVETAIRGNVVICKLSGGVVAFSEGMVAPPARSAAVPADATYTTDAVAAVGRLTRQRVSSLVSSHDREADVATEVFTLEASLLKGSPRGSRSV